MQCSLLPVHPIKGQSSNHLHVPEISQHDLSALSGEVISFSLSEPTVILGV
jgi:hypothetical protein